MGTDRADEMLEGLYKVKFRTGADEGFCICLFKGGRVSGGGSVMYYVGSYQFDGSRFTIELEAKRHAKKSKPSPVLGLDEFHMTMEGMSAGAYAQAIGKIAEVPEAVFMANFAHLCDI
jgi:hypothetical protein